MPTGSSTGTIVRPKVHHTRPSHPPPDPPIPEACIPGQEPRHTGAPFCPHTLAQQDQRHSYPDRLVRSRSSDIVCTGRRPTSDPGLNRRAVPEDRELGPAGFALGPSSSPSKDSLKGEVWLGQSLPCTQSLGLEPLCAAYSLTVVFIMDVRLAFNEQWAKA